MKPLIYVMRICEYTSAIVGAKGLYDQDLFKIIVGFGVAAIFAIAAAKIKRGGI